MKSYRIRTKAGVYAGNAIKIDRFGEMRLSGFAPTTNRMFARVYSEEDTYQMRADIIRLAQFVRESVEDFSLEEVA
jgi:hypothetical protein